MKNNWIALLTLSLLAAACNNQPAADNQSAAAKTAISVKGSDTVLPLSQKTAETYMAANPGVAITVVGGGSGTGITALLDGTTEICMSSRDLKAGEKLKFKEKQMDVREVIVGYDALSVIVHPSNPVQQLTREQLEQIFTGAITNWKDVGGKNAPIVAYCRESSSGTYEFFKEHVMDKKNYASSVLNMPATGAIVQSVSQTEGAIGYIGLAYSTGGVKALNVSYDQGKTFVAPSVAGAKDKSYPIARPLFFFYDAKNASRVQGFVDYVLSDAGQKNVAEIGYVPVK
ncbi:MAG: phosphate ABC transporter substrate-binding protein [Saprospiraceae bacterium]|nr:phosphate ABC transporter substrate-binding protein [Saprospiraceae bacterium]